MEGNDSLLGRLVDRARELKDAFVDWMSQLKSDNPVLQTLIVSLRMLVAVGQAIGQVFSMAFGTMTRGFTMAVAGVSGLASGDFGALNEAIKEYEDFQGKNDKFLMDRFKNLIPNIQEAYVEANFGSEGVLGSFSQPRSVPAMSSESNTSNVTNNMSVEVRVDGAQDPEAIGRAVREEIQASFNPLSAQTAGAQ